MKNHTTTIPNQSTRIFGVILMAALLAPFTVMAESPARVDLGTAGDFTLLAKTGISVTGTSAITGAVGVSPAAATYLTGFGLLVDPANTFSTSSIVTGKIYAADYTSPTPTKLTAAVSDMETAYTNAAGRENPDFTELFTGDITGQTLTPGVYKWSTGVMVSAGGVTLSGSADDIWIFQIAQNLEMANGAAVTLIGGAQVGNIFWQVAGQTTIGTTAAMKGIILCQTAIVMSTGATLSGRGLAQTEITLDANDISMPEVVNAVTYRSVSQKKECVQKYNNQSIEFIVPTDGRATLRIVTSLGQNVATLFNGEVQAGKNNMIPFAASGLAKGWYLSNLEVNGTNVLTRMLLVR